MRKRRTAGRKDSELELTPDDFDRLYPVAFVEVGRTAAEQLRWLGRFSQRALDSPEALKIADTEMLVFSFRRLDFFPMQSANSVMDAEIRKPLQHAEIPAIQSQVRQCLDNLRTKGTFSLPVPLVHRIEWREDEGVWPASDGDALARFLTLTVELLLACGRKLRFCSSSSCHLPFLAARTQQRYCSTRCRNAAGVSRFRENHRSSLNANRRNRYREKLELKHGSRIRIQTGRAKK